MDDALLRKEISAMLDKAENVDYSIRLPDTEYDVMAAIWNGEIPATTGYLMKKLGNLRNWKAPTLISFLVRLEERGFIYSIKKGKERLYFPLAKRDTYIRAVTADFMQKYHDGSFLKLLDVLFPEGISSEADVDALLAWLRSRK